ncbi:hypothetical protein ACQ4M3_07840 [Leptolyngbya sp. AN03gr2]|uniref:hypothetical protein n=1 Tax=unclassified Leptolyngbya TaxID=2650499 RepID=UPI003D313678
MTQENHPLHLIADQFEQTQQKLDQVKADLDLLDFVQTLLEQRRNELLQQIQAQKNVVSAEA